ncbi:TetR/AcrR family transcriptional regulator [Nocardioides marmoriginsengisoli]|uniref:TetR/AcrR family transcriptional regulator n=2 Tax=Nocardioides marmoriginsengisoli TaxID=661483 RepID=A0A3N0CG63_9ACTN|nr:TetR/AcrR family transcriptional regulator [Nocardioides marmoriginsengisoli]
MSGRGSVGAKAAPRGADRTDEIRAVALRLFATNGYQATTMAHIADELGIRAPSIYNHVGSKNQLLREIIVRTLDSLTEGFDEAIRSSQSPTIRLRRAFEAHVRFHARHKYEAFIGTRETRSLDPEALAEVLERSSSYERRFRELIREGVDAGEFNVASVHLASCALIDMGIGVAAWYEEDRSTGEDGLVFHYGEWAMRLLGVGAA